MNKDLDSLGKHITYNILPKNHPRNIIACVDEKFLKELGIKPENNMTFNEYQAKALETAQYPEVWTKRVLKFKGSDAFNPIDFVYPALGLLGEAGEVAEKLKKVIRDENGIITPEKKTEIKKELGDVMWYLAVLSKELGIELLDVAETNISKLASRKQRGKIQGDGDNR